LILNKYIVLVRLLLKKKAIFNLEEDASMANLLEMAAEIVASHASTTPMTKEELIAELNDLHQALVAIESGTVLEMVSEDAEADQSPIVSRKKAFGKDKVVCMICGKPMKTLARHLKTAHGMTASEYRKQYDIPRTQPLAARAYSESRRQMAIDRGLGENLARARAQKAKGKAKK
jgi:predicted transcriptional regulator